MARFISWSRALIVLLVFGCLISGLYADPVPPKKPPVVVSPDGKFVAVALGNAVSVSNALTQKEVFRFTGSNAPISALAYSPDGQRLAVGSLDKLVTVLDAATGKQLLRLAVLNPVIGVSYSLDGKTLTSVETDLTTKVWDVSTGQLLQVTKKK